MIAQLFTKAYRFGGVNLFGKVMSIAALGSSLANVAFLQRFLESVVGIIALTILSAMMAGMLIFGCLLAAFLGLEYSGVSLGLSLSIVGGIALLLATLIISLTIRQVQKTKTLTFQGIQADPFARVTRVTSAFVDGFATHRKTRNS